MAEQRLQGTGPLEAAYAEARDELRCGRVARARICISRAARELAAVGEALDRPPRRAVPPGGLRRRIPASEIQRGALAIARQRIAALVAEVAALTRETEAARNRVRARRQVRRQYGSQGSAGGTLVDQSR